MGELRTVVVYKHHKPSSSALARQVLETPGNPVSARSNKKMRKLFLAVFMLMMFACTLAAKQASPFAKV